MTTNLTKDNPSSSHELETSLLQQIGPGSTLQEPDYQAMWMRMERLMTAEDKQAARQGQRSNPQRTNSRLRLRKVALATTLGAALVTVPAYAAIQYDWSAWFQQRESIQEALKQGLGQEINQSITHDGVTLTLHTALTDEGRTLILYSLEGEGRSVQDSEFSSILLKDEQGRTFEAHATQTPSHSNDPNTALTGYFETDWSPGEASQSVQLIAEGLAFHETTEHPVNFDASSGQPSLVKVGEAGVGSAELWAIDQGDGRMMIRTSVTPEDGKSAAAAVSLAAFTKNGQAIPPLNGAIHGTPNPNGGYTNQDYFPDADLLQQGVTYKLFYEQTTDEIASSWTFPLVLDGSKMAHASAEHKMNVPLGSGDSEMTVKKLTITPTQIRIDLNRGKMFASPFNEYRLIVDGQEVGNPLGWFDGTDPQDSQLVMDRPANLELSSSSVIELRAQHEVLKHDGDLPSPLQLTSISEQKQTLETIVGGYPVTWTYHKQNGNLVIQASSDQPNFGGIGQTYLMEGSTRKLADERSTRIWGDANNKLTEVYQNYTGDQAELHIFYYMEHRPEQREQVKLYPAE